MKRILMYMKKYVKESIFAPLFKMLEAIFELFVPLVVASIIDRGIGVGDKSYIIKMCLLMLGLAVIGFVCSITAQYFAAKAAVGSASRMRSELFRHIQSLGYTEMDKLGTSTLIARMTSDINQVQNGINLVLRLFLRSPFIVFGAMIMAFTIDVKSAMVFVVIIPLLAAVVFGVMIATRPMYKKVQAGLDKILGITRENLTGVRVIRAFNREDTELKNFKNANNDLSILQKRAGLVSGLTNPITFAMINLAVIVLVNKGAVRVDSGVISQGDVVALYNYMTQILVELIKLANLIVSMAKALASANRINDLFEVKPEMKYGLSDENMDDTAVEFRNVSFSYSGAGAEAISDISFSVKKGQTVGVIGGTGSGKSSLVNLIPRFYDPAKGQVLIYGKDASEYNRETLRKMIAVVPQKAQLFKGSIRDNLKIGNMNADNTVIEKAIEISQAKEFIDSKDGRLDFAVEQGGKNLSGGQKQRLTIARALVSGSEILIMDDSASALDYATDAKLRKALKTMDGAPTVFIVSQRASSVMSADMIIVLDDGNAVGIGTHEQLMESCGVYREIYNSQFRKEA
ncbi:MAG: ABC transporter ATP-binding protein [Huintestinicola sp.]